MLFFKLFRRRKQIAQDRLSWRMLSWIVIIFTLHVYLITRFEQLSWMDSFWYSATAALTVGFGDIAPKTVEGRITTILLIYVGLIFIIAKTANDWFELVSTRVEKKLKGSWSYHMKNHVVFIGHPVQRPEVYLRALIRQLTQDERYADKEFIIVSNTLESLPGSLNQLGVKWVKGPLNQWETLEKADVVHADAVFLIAPSSSDTDFDSFSMDIIDHLRDKGCKAYIVAEVVHDENDARLKRRGADATIRVTHGYPNIAARSLTVKGSEQIIQNIFSDDNEECVRIDFSGVRDWEWTGLVLHCLTSGLGTPIACVDEQGKVHTSPMGKTLRVSSVYVISSSSQKENTRMVELA